MYFYQQVLLQMFLNTNFHIRCNGQTEARDRVKNKSGCRQSETYSSSHEREKRTTRAHNVQRKTHSGKNVKSR